jgi:hypothetical protein
LIKFTLPCNTGRNSALCLRSGLTARVRKSEPEVRDVECPELDNPEKSI